jgi:hypothetical protein
MTYTLIDSPITPYSSTQKIEEWIVALSKKEQNEQVKNAIKEAYDLLDYAKKQKSKNGVVS